MPSHSAKHNGNAFHRWFAVSLSAHVIGWYRLHCSTLITYSGYSIWHYASMCSGDVMLEEEPERFGWILSKFIMQIFQSPLTQPLTTTMKICDIQYLMVNCTYFFHGSSFQLYLHVYYKGWVMCTSNYSHLCMFCVQYVCTKERDLFGWWWATKE